MLGLLGVHGCVGSVFYSRVESEFIEGCRDVVLSGLWFRVPGCSSGFRSWLKKLWIRSTLFTLLETRGKVH